VAAANNDYLLQFQGRQFKSLFKDRVIYETTALGAAFLAGLAVDSGKGFRMN